MCQFSLAISYLLVNSNVKCLKVIIVTQNLLCCQYHHNLSLIMEKKILKGSLFASVILELY